MTARTPLGLATKDGQRPVAAGEKVSLDGPELLRFDAEEQVRFVLFAQQAEVHVELEASACPVLLEAVLKPQAPLQASFEYLTFPMDSGPSLCVKASLAMVGDAPIDVTF